MEIDTLALVSPPLPTALLDDIRRSLSCFRRTEPDGRTSFELFSGSLAGSYDHRVSVRIVFDQLGRERLRLEGSVHKAICGHNILGGPVDLLPAARWFVARIGAEIGVHLPSGALWRPHRVDLAVMYDLGSLEAVNEAVRCLQGARVARRSLRAYGSETACFPGGRFTAKVYAKGPEFRKHDLARLREWLAASPLGVSPGDAADLASLVAVPLKIESSIEHCIMEGLASLADTLLRVEVEFKRRHWISVVGSEGCVSDIPQVELVEAFWSEVGKVSGGFMSELERVNKASAVWDRLRELHPSARASMLYGTWMDLAAFGEDRTRQKLSRPTFYRHRKALIAAGCDWIGADVMERPSLLPDGFSLSRNSPYLVPPFESREVVEALRPFRVA